MNSARSLIKSLIALAFVGNCLLPLNSPAIDLKQSKFTQVVNDVEIISAADKSLHAAAINDTFKMPDVLRTGPASRTELVAADGTITRVGANTIFSYDTQNRTIDLQQGSLLFHSPHGKGGGTIRTGSATASVIGTTIIVTCTPDGGFKLLDLEGETEVRFLNGMRQQLEPGQMTFILPGETHPSPIIVFRLDDQTKGSLLLNGFGSPLPSIGKIDAEVTRQLLNILNNQAGDTGLLVGNHATANSVEAFQEINAEHTRQNNNAGGGGNNSGGGDGEIVIYDDNPINPISAFPGDGNVTLNGSSIYISDSTISTASGYLQIYGNSYGNGLVTIIGSTITSENDVDISSVGNIDIESTTLSAGDSASILALNGSVTLNNDSISSVNNVDVLAGTGLTVSGTSITADPDVGTISLNNASGITTINNGSSLQAYTITLNSGDGILLDGTGGTFSGNEIDLASGNADGSDEIDVQNADLTAFANVNISAHTVNLTDVAFGGESMVHLNSFFGLLADNPNTGAASQPGYVNFINGVTYGGTLITSDNQSTYVNPGSGSGIYIGTLGAGTVPQSASLSAHTVNLMNTTFSGGSSVNLNSFYGAINSNNGSTPGYVNFNNGTFGGNPVIGPGQTQPPIGGPGIHINSVR
jgi:hypothetical protein